MDALALSEAPTFYEFFAGGGFARLGLGPGWRCLFANDWEEAKAASYRANWGAGEMRVTDVHALTLQDLPGRADLAWASFPCQDLSLAGAGAGLSGARSGAFWGFHALIRGLVEGGRAPALIALENVVGLLSANCGADFAALARAFDGLGYGLSALVLDAAAFVPQSRPRLFVVARAAGVEVPGRATPDPALAPASLVAAWRALPDRIRARWSWPRLPAPATRRTTLADLLEPDGGVAWRAAEATQALLDLMSSAHRTRVDQALRSGEGLVGAGFRRMRPDGAGGRVQRFEARFDGVAGCLRTPAGGSSRQTLLVIERGRARSRLFTSREEARLMGAPDGYQLPGRATTAAHLVGDAVAPPVVAHLARHLFAPALALARDPCAA